MICQKISKTATLDDDDVPPYPDLRSVPTAAVKVMRQWELIQNSRDRKQRCLAERDFPAVAVNVVGAEPADPTARGPTPKNLRTRGGGFRIP